MESNQNNAFRSAGGWSRPSNSTQYSSSFESPPPPSYGWNNATNTYPLGYDYGNGPHPFQSSPGVSLSMQSHPTSAPFASPPGPPQFHSMTSNVPPSVPLDPQHSSSDALQQPSDTVKKSQNARRSRYSPADWETHRSRIKKLYIEDDKSLEETMAVMTANFSFSPS